MISSLQRRTLAGIGVAAALALAAPVVPATAAPADDVASAVNTERASAGVGPLARDAALDAMADEWARHLAGAAFGHSTNSWRQERARPGFTLCCGENIAAGQADARQVMQGWMGSPGHRANILNARYSHLGVGHVVAPGTRYGHYWVQVFATYPADRAGDGAFVRALYRDFLGRSAASSEVDSWLATMDRGASRHAVAASLARSDEWISTIVTRFYRDTLGRGPDAAGLRHWVDLARAGRPIAQIAADFYASDEYFAKYGKSDRATWLGDLYTKLLNRSPDQPGMRHWLGKLASGTSRNQVAIEFYQSEETARKRVQSLYQALLGRSADPAGLRTWPAIVRTEGDLELAAYLAGSEEYYRRAQR